VVRTAGTFATLPRLVAALVRVSPGKVAIAVTAMLGLSFLEGLGVLLLVPLLALVGVDHPAGSTTSVVRMFDRAFRALGVSPTLALVLLVYVGVVALRTALLRGQAALMQEVLEEFTAGLRLRVYRAIAAARWSFLVSRRASDHVHVMMAEVPTAGAAAQHLVDLTVTGVIATAYLAVALYLVEGALAAPVLLSGALLAWMVRRRIDDARTIGRRVSTTRSRLGAAMIEHLGSMKTAKAYGIVRRHATLFTRLSDELRAAGLEASASAAGLEVRLTLGLTVLLAIIVYVSRGVLSVPTGQLLVLVFVFARLMPRFANVYRQVHRLAAALPAFDAVIDLARRCAEAAEPAEASASPVDLRDGIRLENVTFDYGEDSEAPALQDIDLKIPAGSTTAIVGPSGAGKTTLADLLIGLLPPARGQVLVDGEPLGPANLAAWRDLIGYVPQDMFLFNDTVRANLVWARPQASDPEIWRALELAAADALVRTLPGGLETIIGDDAVRLSGGERQRLALAQALLREPHVLVLDEAASALDSENELRIRRAITSLPRRMTVVIITHRLSTVRDADVIHVIDRGRLIESGSWHELYRRTPSRFRDLCLAQGIRDDGARSGC
jgi:ATP-binding cassette, subfamily C, bacterial